MKKDSMGKLSAGFLVLVMALSAIVLFPSGNEGQTTSSTNIYVPVISGGSPVTGAYVNLTEVHTGAVIPAQYADGVYVATNPPSGYYLVSVVHSEYYDAPSASEVPFDGRTNYTVTPVQLDDLPTKTLSITVSVNDSATLDPIQGAYVSVYDNTARETVSSAALATNATGKTTISMFKTDLVPTHGFCLVARKAGYEMSATQVTITTAASREILLNASMKVSGFVIDSSSSRPALGVVAYLIDKDSDVPFVKRVMKVQGAVFAFDAYPGNFTFVVDADGCAGDVQNVTVSGDDQSLTIPPLGPQTKRVAQTHITYTSDDFSDFTLNVSGDWPYDLAHPGLSYRDMGNLRMQVDLALGNGNGSLDGADVFEFTQRAWRWGSEYLATDGLLLVNDTVYYNKTFSGWPFQLAEGWVVDSKSPVPFSYTCTYEATGIDVKAPDYEAIMYVKLDTDEVDYKYSLALPKGYELVSNKSQYTSVKRYLNVSLDPSMGTPDSEPVELGIQEHKTPSSVAKLQTAPSVVYAETDVNKTVLKYYVKVDANITFSSVGSADPNGNPLDFTWDFGDGSTAVTTRNDTYVYKYNTASADRTVVLNVSDVAGNYSVSQVKVVCDKLDPNPVITVKDLTVADSTVTITQRTSVTFNASGTTDDAAAAGDLGGKIDFVQFDWGDGNKSDQIYSNAQDQNVTYTFAVAGTWNVTLNATDVTGHWKTTILKVKVNDTTAPTISFVVKNATGSSTLVEKEPLWFDATATYDNLDANSSLVFSWNFGDGNWTNGTGTAFMNVTHTYDLPKSYTVSLNVTDTAGNSLSSPKIITVGQGARPKMRVDKVFFNLDSTSYKPGNFTEDEQGYIFVNMTNVGSKYATGIQVTFYLIKADNTEEILAVWTQVYNATTGELTDNVSVGGTVQLRFPWTFGTKGTYTIKVNATASEQYEPHEYTVPSKLTVKEAPWKRVVLWAGVVAVIVLVPLLLYLRSRWSKRERKGPRREKKEKPASGEEEL